MGPTKPGHDESTSLMTISSPPVPGGDPSTGVRERQTSDHRTRPPPRPRRNGGIADPEGFEPSTAGLEIRCPIRARRRVRARSADAGVNNPSTGLTDLGNLVHRRASSPL